jgi:hypothetical protein
MRIDRQNRNMVDCLSQDKSFFLKYVEECQRKPVVAPYLRRGAYA